VASNDASSAPTSSPAAGGGPGRDPNLWLLFAVTLVAVGNVSSVAPAFPQVVDVFGVPRAQVELGVTAYSLPGILSAPVAGGLGDWLGRERVPVGAVAVLVLRDGSEWVHNRRRK